MAPQRERCHVTSSKGRAAKFRLLRRQMGILLLTLAALIRSSAAAGAFPCPPGDKGSAAVIPGTVCGAAPLLTQQIHPRHRVGDAAHGAFRHLCYEWGNACSAPRQGYSQFAMRKSIRVIASLKHTKQDFLNVPLQQQMHCQNHLNKSISFQAQCRKPRTYLALHLVKSF